MGRTNHIGSRFDELLAEDGQLESATAVAAKRVVTWQFKQDELRRPRPDGDGRAHAHKPRRLEPQGKRGVRVDFQEH